MANSASRPALPLIVSGIALALAGALAGFALGRGGTGGMDKAAIETVVHNYILEHPEILPQAMETCAARKPASNFPTWVTG